MTYDASDRLLRVDGLPAGTVLHRYGHEGKRVKTKAPDVSISYFFGDGTAERNGIREHDVTVGDRVIARAAVPAETVPGVAAATGAAADALSDRPSAGWRMLPALLGFFALWLALLRRPTRWGFASARTRHGAGVRAGAVLLLALFSWLSCSSPSLRAGAQTLAEQASVTFLQAGFGVGPVVFTDPAGKVLEERRTEPFGESIDARTLTAAGYVVGDPDLLARDLNSLNKRTEVATGWSDHGARWMAPETARWLTPDPPVTGPDSAFMDEPWALHPYQYVHQNPMMYWDPDGRDASGQQFRAPPGESAEAVYVGVKLAQLGEQIRISYEQNAWRYDTGIPRQSFSESLGPATQIPGVGGVARVIDILDAAADGTLFEARDIDLSSLSPPDAPGFPRLPGKRGDRPAYVPRTPDGRPLPLPRGKNGELAPSSMDPHTQIGWQEGRRGGYVQTREFGPNGQPARQIDWTDHGRPAQHTDPHVHEYLPNPTGGTPQHGPARPPRPGEF
jgi:RHS repeat-associated protein